MPTKVENALTDVRDRATRLLERLIQRGGKMDSEITHAMDNLEEDIIRSYDALPPQGMQTIPELAHMGVAANVARRKFKERFKERKGTTPTVVAS